MNLKLHWNKGLIFKEERTIGYFMKDSLHDCNSQLYEKQIRFKALSVVADTVSIMDNDNTIIGMIFKSKFYKGFRIILDDVAYDLRPANFFKRKWKLFEKRTEVMELNKGIFNQGRIHSIFKNEQLILASLFVLNRGN